MRIKTLRNEIKISITDNKNNSNDNLIDYAYGKNIKYP